MKRKVKKVKIFKGLMQALEEAAAYERGEARHLRVTRFPSAPRISSSEIREIRESLQLSQALFAHLLNVSPKAVQSWEQGTRKPQSAALKLLALARKNPDVLLHA